MGRHDHCGPDAVVARNDRGPTRFRRYGLPAPDRSTSTGAEVVVQVERLERWLPDDFPTLARNEAFTALLRGIGARRTRHALRSQLISTPLGTDAVAERPVVTSNTPPS